MTRPDHHVLTTSTLNPFLYAGVGTELNGSELTILSLLARLGSDPWVEAARLAAMPATGAIEWLAGRIGQMPLTAQALGQARTTATRLILLLPSQTDRRGPTTASRIATVPLPQWVMVALVLGALALSMAATWSHPQASPPPNRHATDTGND
jgi:hypothetical protein